MGGTCGLFQGTDLFCRATREIQVEKEEERLYQFLFGLKDSHNMLRDQLLSMEPLSIVNKAYALLIRGEKQKKVIGVQTSQSEAMALAVKAVTERPNKKIGSKKKVKIIFDATTARRHDIFMIDASS